MLLVVLQVLQSFLLLDCAAGAVLLLEQVEELLELQEQQLALLLDFVFNIDSWSTVACVSGTAGCAGVSVAGNSTTGASAGAS